MAPVLVSSAAMSDPHLHRLNLLLACAGALVMLAATVGRLEMWVEYRLPRFEISHPAIEDWPEAAKARHAA